MRTIEIIFWGLFLFVNTGGTYQVLIPDGRNATDLGVPAHTPMFDVRPTTAKANPSWGDWAKSVKKNQYVVEQPCKSLEISGLSGEPTPINVDDFTERLPHVGASDPFIVAANPQTMGELTIKQGTLNVHQFRKGMIATRWSVHVKPGAKVTISCVSKDDVNHALELNDATEQVLFKNAAAGMQGENHFVLYRVLSTERKRPLHVVNPNKPPLGPAPVVGEKDTLHIDTPFVDCSNAGYP